MKTWRHDYPGGAQGQIVRTGQTILASVIPAVPLDAAGQGAPPPVGANSLADAVAAANVLAAAQSGVQDWRLLPQNGDTIVEKRPDGAYDVLRIVAGNRALARANVADLNHASQIAREGLDPNGTTVWSRDSRDPFDHLEPF